MNEQNFRISSQQPATSCVLLVDDEMHVLDILSEHLERAGCRVLTASNGQQALELARESLPQVIVMDQHMPDLTGSQVCEELLRHPATASIPVIILTGAPSEVKIGANVRRMIGKPFSLRDVVRSIVELGMRRRLAA